MASGIREQIIGLKCIGAAMQSIEETIAHTKKRMVFGSSLATNQAVSFGIVEEVMKLLIACSRFGRDVFNTPMRHETAEK